jgi:hypothetical protein
MVEPNLEYKKTLGRNPRGNVGGSWRLLEKFRGN